MLSIDFASRSRWTFLKTLLACAVVLPMSIAHGQETPFQEAPRDRNRAIIGAAFDRWAAGGSDFFNEVLAQDVVWTIEGTGPNAGTYRGRDDLIERAVRPLATRLTKPIRPVSTRIWADGDHVIVNWEGEAVARDGKPYSNTYVWILRMDGERATEVTAFLDLVAYEDVLRRIPHSELR
ncbi:nuclear transport factor 2 family protein [Agrobacterium tumefaciens]|uniref:nuclear transport factor 2 family protein n=1 Tax=Agrobacterium tumefaciens TaxID=358 RepID=UPI000DCF6F47|nr:nuclear transport factor 2 family protein [Agrobacterium tumefaciens]UNZ53049.1 nuclear transport factor 2 family protein [Agrobacterium tumefaciens]